MAEMRSPSNARRTPSEVRVHVCNTLMLLLPIVFWLTRSLVLLLLAPLLVPFVRLALLPRASLTSGAFPSVVLVLPPSCISLTCAFRGRDAQRSVKRRMQARPAKTAEVVCLCHARPLVLLLSLMFPVSVLRSSCSRCFSSRLSDFPCRSFGPVASHTLSLRLTNVFPSVAEMCSASHERPTQARPAGKRGGGSLSLSHAHSLVLFYLALLYSRVFPLVVLFARSLRVPSPRAPPFPCLSFCRVACALTYAAASRASPLVLFPCSCSSSRAVSFLAPCPHISLTCPFRGRDPQRLCRSATPARRPPG